MVENIKNIREFSQNFENNIIIGLKFIPELKKTRACRVLPWSLIVLNKECDLPRNILRGKRIGDNCVLFLLQKSGNED